MGHRLADFLGGNAITKVKANLIQVRRASYQPILRSDGGNGYARIVDSFERRGQAQTLVQGPQQCPQLFIASVGPLFHRAFSTGECSGDFRHAPPFHLGHPEDLALRFRQLVE